MGKIKFYFPLFFVLLLSACKVENQKTGEIFSANTLPQILYRIANQIHELVAVEGEIVKTSTECNPDCLDVAVIDNGVDLAHPDLYRRIHFSVKNNRMAGAGWDVLGDDSYASSNLMNPTLFAFGAGKIENGRITNPPANPLDLIAEYNQSFMETFVTHVRASKELQGTLFDQMSFQHTSLYELHKLVNAKTDMLKAFEERKKIYGVFRRGDLPKLEKNPAAIDPAVFHLLETNPWRTYVQGMGTTLDGYDKLLEIAENDIKTFPKAAEYAQALESLIQYLDGRDFDESTTQDRKVNDSLDKVNTALTKKLYGHLNDDSIYNLELANELTLLQRSYIKGEKVEIPLAKPQAMAQNLDESYQLFGNYLNYVSKMPNLTLAEKLNTQEAVKNYQKYLKLAKWADQERKLAEVPTYSGYKPNFDSHLYRKRFIRANHPFVSEKSVTESHGSHVSGIILSQAEGLKIVPVRVSTESLQLPKDIRNEYASKFKTGFHEWMNNPLVFRAVGSKLSKWFPQWNFNDLSRGNREKVSNEIMGLLDDSINLSVDDHLLDHVFVEEIIKAVKYVGTQKIKVANISLGTSFEKPPQHLGDGNPVTNLKEFFAFLKFEYFKFKLGEEIRNSAAETVFVVAAGNESNWVDGQSRSALPVDLSSPFLMGFERPEFGEVAPNNGLKNVIAVGSLDREDQLSSFTNVFLGKHVPFVFARGEVILSAIKSVDTSGIDQALMKWYPDLDNIMTLGMTDARLKPFAADLWKKMSGKKTEPTSEEIDYMQKYLSYTMALIGNHDAFFRNHLAVRFAEHKAVMSGTSMASPAVAGALGKLILEKKAKLGLQGQSIYDNPEFKAEVLVQELMSRTEPIDPNNNLYGLKKLVGLKEMVDTEQDLDKFLKAL
jgi:subtilisin family serine protease